MRRPMVEENPTMMRINVTPIIDVALVLVIILLITAPMISAAKMEIELPTAQTRAGEEQQQLSITISSDGELAIDDDLISAPMLSSQLRERVAAADGAVLVVVRADAGTPYPLVKTVLEEARAAGAQRIAIATRHRGSKRPW